MSTVLQNTRSGRSALYRMISNGSAPQHPLTKHVVISPRAEDAWINDVRSRDRGRPGERGWGATELGGLSMVVEANVRTSLVGRISMRSMHRMTLPRTTHLATLLPLRHISGKHRCSWILLARNIRRSLVRRPPSACSHQLLIAIPRWGRFFPPSGDGHERKQRNWGNV